MEISCRCKGEVTILDLAGRFRVSPGETEILTLRSTVADLVAEGRVCVALHLTGLASIDARGLGELLHTLTTLRARGGDLMLIAPTAAVKKVLAVTRLDKVFPLCDSELEATRRIRRVVPSAGDGLLTNECVQLRLACSGDRRDASRASVGDGLGGRKVVRRVGERRADDVPSLFCPDCLAPLQYQGRTVVEPARHLHGRRRTLSVLLASVPADPRDRRLRRAVLVRTDVAVRISESCEGAPRIHGELLKLGIDVCQA
jgi:anti-sigma B factor antagonist